MASDSYQYYVCGSIRDWALGSGLWVRGRGSAAVGPLVVPRYNPGDRGRPSPRDVEVTHLTCSTASPRFGETVSDRRLAFGRCPGNHRPLWQKPVFRHLIDHSMRVS